MPANFNPFADWLGLKNANPHHFQLLGVSTKITDPAEIKKAVEAGVKRNLILLDQIPAGEHDDVIKQVKQRVMIARKTLLDSDARQVYLNKLKQRTKTQQSAKLDVPPAAPTQSDLSPPAPAPASFTASAPRKSVFTPPTIGEPPTAETSPATNQAIPLAVPLSPSTSTLR